MANLKELDALECTTWSNGSERLYVLWRVGDKLDVVFLGSWKLSQLMTLNELQANYTREIAQ